MIYYKSPHEIEVISVGGRILTRISREIMAMIEPGISTKDIEERARNLFKKTR